MLARRTLPLACNANIRTLPAHRSNLLSLSEGAQHACKGFLA
jgi:hypothetical protein